DFLRRMEEKGFTEVRFWSTLPRDEAEVARALEQAAGHAREMSAWDRRRLEHFRDLFDPARKRSGTRLRRQDGAFSLHGSAEYFTGGYYRDSLPRPDQYAFGSFTPAIQLAYADWAYLASSGTVVRAKGRV